MADIEKDIQLLNDTISGRTSGNEDNHIWPRTSEDVFKMLEIIDVKNKDVFTVLSSSDIPFSLIAKKVKSIRTFDINPLTYRYYYLRKWMLEYGILDGQELSFWDTRDIINAKREYIKKDEEESVRFWNLYLKRMKKGDFFWLYDTRLFKYVSERFKCPYDDDIESLLEYLKQVELEFENIDISGDNLDKNKKCDIVYLSNIMDLHTDKSVKKIRDNLYDILRDNGQVLCTNIVNHPHFDLFRDQRRVFEEKFEYDEVYVEIIGQEKCPYYRYIKK